MHESHGTIATTGQGPLRVATPEGTIAGTGKIDSESMQAHAIRSHAHPIVGNPTGNVKKFHKIPDREDPQSGVTTRVESRVVIGRSKRLRR
jgi:hypothetical protein